MQIKLDDAQPHHFATFRDKRLQDGNRACQYDLVLLRAAWNTARIEWGWDLRDNPLTLIRFPKSNPPRERRLREGEYERLMAAVRGGALSGNLTYSITASWMILGLVLK